jgi:hypothetical protein
LLYAEYMKSSLVLTALSMRIMQLLVRWGALC